MKMSDVKKSALWALACVPITVYGGYNTVGLLHAGDLWLAPFIPALLAYSVLAPPGSPDWWFITVGLISQFLGYFLIVFIFFKLKQATVKNIAKEQSEKDQIA